MAQEYYDMPYPEDGIEGKTVFYKKLGDKYETYSPVGWTYGSVNTGEVTPYGVVTSQEWYLPIRAYVSDPPQT